MHQEGPADADGDPRIDLAPAERGGGHVLDDPPPLPGSGRRRRRRPGWCIRPPPPRTHRCRAAERTRTRAMALTAIPMTSRTRPAPNRALSSVPVASPKLLTMSEGRVAAGDLIEWAMNGELPMTRATATVSPRARPVARVKAAEDAGAGPGDHHLAQHLPAGGAEGHGPFHLLVGHHGQHVAGDGHHGGQHHDEQDDAGQQQAHPVVGPVEQPGPPEHGGQEGLDGARGTAGPARSGPTARRRRSAPRPAARPRWTAPARSRSGTR